MARQGNSETVGLGWREHRKPRKNAIATMPDGTPCPYGYCGHAPMYRDKTRNWDGLALHYDHIIARALGGHRGPKQLAHAKCNIKAGQVVRAQLRRSQPRTRRPRPAAYNRW